MKDKNIIFLDIDGVLNCQLFYEKMHREKIIASDIPAYKQVKKQLRKSAKREEMGREQYYKEQLCPTRMEWLNQLCLETNSVVVISSTWRSGKTVDELQKTLNNSGATFTIIDKTGHNESRVRGVEIWEWMDKNITKDTWGDHAHDFERYAIIDDDSDMMLWQAKHFFQTDSYSGLTPSTCYKIKRFLTKRAFEATEKNEPIQN